MLVQMRDRGTQHFVIHAASKRVMAQESQSSRGAQQPIHNHSLQTAIDRVIAQESLSNECKLAYVRAIVLAISASLDTLVFFFPKTLIGADAVSPTIALISSTACAIAIGIVILLLHPAAWRWLARLQIAIPIFDSLLLALFITNIWRVFSVSKPDIITNIAALCCLVAVSGSIRIRRQASVLTTALALTDFAYAAWLFRLDLAVSLFALFTILGIGLLGMLIAGIVRRQGKNAAGRLLMQQFLPRNVVEAAFEQPAHLLDAPKQCEVTIMMTDLRNFTRYAESLDPLAVMNFLSQLQGFLSTIVEQHGGWVDKFMGDGMLAVFGAPEELENDAEQAVKAACLILDNIQQWSPLPIGIGIHSGSIVAGCVGTGRHLEFTAIGDAVNVASRLEALTKKTGCPLLISYDTQQKLENWPLISLGKLPIRGRNEPVEVFTIPSVKAN